MEKLGFKEIHNVVLDYLKENDNRKLYIIGSWYYRFLKSENEKLSLHLPYFLKDLTKLAYNYIRAFTFVFNLLRQEKITQFTDTCLFDIFNVSPNSNIENLTLDFIKQKDNIALWGEETLTVLDSFLPVFNKEELVEFDNPKTIKNTFDLFRSMRNYKIIANPLLIDLQETILTFNNIDINLVYELISEKLFFIDRKLDDDSAMEVEDELIEKGLINRINLKYPYSKNPHPYLMDVGKKKFKLIFNNRFAYNEIQGEDIFLLPDETNLSTKLVYNIVDTNHSKELYHLFKNFKEQWTNLELNKYTTPFPKYWFLLLNNSLSGEDWLIQFKKDFPAVSEKPIIRIVGKIINVLINLDWIKDEITNSTKILFPELNSNRKKRLEFIYNNFKNYIHSFNSNIEFISDVDSNNYKNVIVLDSFNIIDLVNKNQNYNKDSINVIVPDFLYFGYQPWIKYHLFTYQFTPLLNGLREKLDNNYISNKEKIEELKKEIIKEIKSELKTYNKKYIEEKEVFVVEPDEEINIEDIEFSNTEEIDINNSVNVKSSQSVIINKSLENELTISSTEKVLLQKDSLVYMKAGNLKRGDYFIRNSDIIGLYKIDSLYDKLVDIPEEVLDYQTKLSAFNNTYQILKQKGISYQNQNYFDANYVINNLEELNFRIPRRKKDWTIICEFLNINYSTEQLAFIAYYGRRKQNELKRIYKSTIDLLLENNWLGAIENPQIVTSVSKIVKQHNNMFGLLETDEITEISESIISTVLDQLSFTEIKTIEIIDNE